MVETEWLTAGLWDNEQVAISTLLFRFGLPGARILKTNIGGDANTVSWLFGAEPYRRQPLVSPCCRPQHAAAEISLSLSP
jgi:hypothetical protein